MHVRARPTAHGGKFIIGELNETLILLYAIYAIYAIYALYALYALNTIADLRLVRDW